ncbi:MAG: thermonuclease family protein [Candidatus Aenigmatarchaeota archaeon]
MKKIWFAIALIAVILIVQGITITGQYLDKQTLLEPLKEKQGPFIVTRIIDGDTLVLNTTEKVRLNGINTPETQECYYEEAKERLIELVLNKEVMLERDITDIDVYDRLLRYIYIYDNYSLKADGYLYHNFSENQKSYSYDKYSEKQNSYSDMIMVNLILVKEGYAKVYDKYKEDTKYYDILKANEPNNIGLWLCTSNLNNCSYVASKNSNLYHNANSSIAKRIKPENILCFQSRTEAENAGLTAG